MQATHRIISRDVIARVNQSFINQQRADTSALPRSVADRIASLYAGADYPILC